MLNEPSDVAWQRVREWDQHFILTDRTAFVATEDMMLTHHVASEVGMNRDGGVKGIVIEATNRAGWNDSAFIEWLGKVT